MNEILKVLAWDGYPISATHYIPENTIGRTLLIIGAVGEDQRRYAAYATHFASLGFNVYTFDFRGVGASRPHSLRSLKADLNDWALLDLDAIISYVVAAHPHQKLILTAHGTGGMLSGISRLSKKADAIVFMGGAVPDRRFIRHLTMRASLAFSAGVIVPILTKLLGYLPGGLISRTDLPTNVAAQLMSWTRNGANEISKNLSPESGFRALDQRALTVHFSDDRLASQEGVAAFVTCFEKLKCEQWRFSPDQVLLKSVGHNGYFRKQLRDALWGDIARWIDNVLSTRRSKAA